MQGSHALSSGHAGCCTINFHFQVMNSRNQEQMEPTISRVNNNKKSVYVCVCVCVGTHILFFRGRRLGSDVTYMTWAVVLLERPKIYFFLCEASHGLLIIFPAVRSHSSYATRGRATRLRLTQGAWVT